MVKNMYLVIFKFNKNYKEDIINLYNKDKKYKLEAINYVNENFKENYGDLNIKYFIYPISFKTAKKWYQLFLENRLFEFGPYQDAV